MVDQQPQNEQARNTSGTPGSGLALTTGAVRSAAGQLRTRLRDRFVGGVPWGTLLLCALLVLTYSFVQRGAGSWTRPLAVPFTSWSYAHPVGVLIGPFAHLGPSHLQDNLLGTLVFGALAEYVVGHRSSLVWSDWESRLRRPVVQAFVMFPLGAMLAGVLASAFAWGPTIGFSNVVYAFAGVALVRYPIGTIVALSVRDAADVAANTVLDPIVVANSTPPGEPWWVDVAVQGHMFGFLLGVVVGVTVIRLRDVSPPAPHRLWVGAVLFGLVQSLWAIWWPEGGSYVLARGPGVVIVFAVATLVTVGVVLATRGTVGNTDEDARRRGLALLVVPLVLMAAVAIPVNAGTNASLPATAEQVTVRGYSITYVEDVPNGRFEPLAALRGGEPATTSGVVVVNPDRGVWTRAVARSQLKRDGTAAVRLGGLTWDRTVFVVRDGWATNGGGVADKVWLNPKDGPFPLVYASEPARAAPIIEGANVSVAPTADTFEIAVSRDNETVGTAPLPLPGKNVTVGGLRIRRSDDTLIAVANDTRVIVARRV